MMLSASQVPSSLPQIHPQPANKQPKRKTHRGSCSLRFGWTKEGKLKLSHDETIFFESSFFQLNRISSKSSCVHTGSRERVLLPPLVLKNIRCLHSGGQSGEIIAGGTWQSPRGRAVKLPGQHVAGLLQGPPWLQDGWFTLNLLW